MDPFLHLACAEVRVSCHAMPILPVMAISGGSSSAFNARVLGWLSRIVGSTGFTDRGGAVSTPGIG